MAEGSRIAESSKPAISSTGANNGEDGLAEHYAALLEQDDAEDYAEDRYERQRERDLQMVKNEPDIDVDLDLNTKPGDNTDTGIKVKVEDTDDDEEDEEMDEGSESPAVDASEKVLVMGVYPPPACRGFATEADNGSEWCPESDRRDHG
jgi:hypothetical protein